MGDRQFRTVRAGSGDHGHPSARGFYAGPNDFQPLVPGKRGAFAGRPARNQCADSELNLPIRKGGEGVVVDGSVVEGGDEGGHYAL